MFHKANEITQHKKKYSLVKTKSSERANGGGELLQPV
jgi:hypothetical protein